MAIKWDKEKTILSLVGGLVTLVLGYLIWRHELKVSSAASAAQLQAQQNIADNQTAQIQNELDAIPQFQAGGGGGYADEPLNSGANDGGASDAGDSAILAEILAAFEPPQPSSASPNPATPTTPVSTGGDTVDQPIGGGGNPTTSTLPGSSVSNTEVPAQTPITTGLQPVSIKPVSVITPVGA